MYAYLGRDRTQRNEEHAMQGRAHHAARSAAKSIEGVQECRNALTHEGRAEAKREKGTHSRRR